MARSMADRMKNPDSDRTHRVVNSPISTALRSLLRLALFLSIIFFLAVYVGIPGRWVQPFIGGLRERGYDLEASLLRIDPLAGIVAENTRIRGDYQGVKFDFTAKRLVLILNLSDWVKPTTLPGGVVVEGGELHLNWSPEGAESCAVLHLEEVHLEASYRGGVLRILDSRARLDRTWIQAHGTLAPGIEKGVTLWKMPVSKAVPATSQQNVSSHWLDRVLKVVAPLEPQWHKAQVDVGFFLVPSNPELNELTFNVSGGGMRYRGYRFDSWAGSGYLRNSEFVLSEASLTSGRTFVQGTMTSRLDEGLIEASITNTLPLLAWSALLPDKVSGLLEALPLRIDEGLTLCAQVGPARPQQLLETLRGSISATKLDFKGVWMDSLSSQFHYHEGAWCVEDIQARVGHGKLSGPLSGSLIYTPENRAYQGSFETGFSPQAASSLLPHSLAVLIGQSEFPVQPPHGQLRADGRIGPGGDLVLTGEISAQDFLFRGVALDKAFIPLQYSGRILTFDGIEACEGEGQASGLLQLDFNQGLVELNMDSTLQPLSAAALAGPFVQRLLSHFYFDGPVKVGIEGQVGFRSDTHEKTQLAFHVDGNNMGALTLRAESLSFDGFVTGPDILLTNMTGKVFGGDFAGTLAIQTRGQGLPPTFLWSGGVHRANLDALLRNLRQKDDSPFEGLLSFRFDMEGQGGDRWKESLRGKGQARIREGDLFRIPLFLGLSNLLSKLYPGLGYIKQSDLDMPFTLRQGVLHTHSLSIRGAAISLRGDGSYSLPEDDFDMDVEVQLLEEGFIASVVRLITMPVTKLFEIHLSGPLATPAWRPKNLPKELFLKFD